MPYNEPQKIFYKNIRNSFEKNLKKILSSPAAKKFFETNYNKNYQNLKLDYHFNREDVQNEIIKRINFIPLINNNDYGFTNQSNMTITINSVPKEISENDVFSFNRKILYLGRLLLTALHEIMGHFTRKYYSYLTEGEVCMNTADEDDLETCYKNEGGFLVETYFLGIQNGKILSLNNCLQILYTPNFENYPIFRKENYIIDEKKIKYIIEENKDIFNFIDKETKVENNYIFLTQEDYLYTIIHIFDI